MISMSKRFLVIAVSFLIVTATATAQENSAAESVYQEASAAHDNGDFEKALELYSRTIELDPDYADAYWNRGNLWPDEENEKALLDYREVTRLAPKFDGGFGNYGFSLLMAGRFDEALTASMKAHRLDNTVYSWPLNVGHSHLMLGDMEMARQFYRWALYRMENRDDLNSAASDFDIFIERGWKAEESAALKKWMLKRYDGKD